jgi:uncharacterized protein YwgA
MATLSAVWKRIGDFDLETLDSRIIFQKTIYLLQRAGLSLGYTFSWYIFGPYCSQLAKEGFEIKEGTLICSEQESELDLVPFDKLKELIKGHEKDSDWYELLASIDFLKTTRRMSKPEIFSDLKKKKGYLGDETKFEEAWLRLESLQ